MAGKKKVDGKDDAIAHNRGKSVKLTEFSIKEAVEEERKRKKEAGKTVKKKCRRDRRDNIEEERVKERDRKRGKGSVGERDQEGQRNLTEEEDSEGSSNMDIEEAAKRVRGTMGRTITVNIKGHLRYVEDLSEKEATQ